MIDVRLTCSSSFHMVFTKPTCSPAAAASLASKLSKVNSHAACLPAVLPHIWLSCMLTWAICALPSLPSRFGHTLHLCFDPMALPDVTLLKENLPEGSLLSCVLPELEVRSSSSSLMAGSAAKVKGW